jgi:RNA polymerase sigma factor (sigma-70 family)
MIPSDLELLQGFARDRLQDAFTELVRRHLNLVYSAALRQVRSPHLAEEIAQSVFTDLARDAARLKPDTVLVAWLHTVTRRTAVDFIRKESRRQLREQIAIEMNAMNVSDPLWPSIEPLLDEAIAALDETDRAAVLLRYFENKSLREVGAQLGVSDDTAQKRVSRAVDKLREFFTKRKVTIGAGSLGILISANAVQSAPVGLAATISAAALAGAAVSTSTLIAATTKTIAMTTLQKTLITATLAVVAGAGIYEAKQAHDAHAEVQTLQQQQAPLADQFQQMRDNYADATNRLAGLLAENLRLQSNSDQTELLKLRGEVGMLRQQTDSLREALTSLQTNSADAGAVLRRWLDTDAARADLSMAMIGYTKSHNGFLPVNFAELAENLASNSPTIQFGDKFEFVVNTPIKRDAPAKNGGVNSGKILFRERVMRQKYTNLSAPPDQVRIYGFTDGSIAEVSAGWLKAMNIGGFGDWEQQHLVSN